MRFLCLAIAGLLSIGGAAACQRTLSTESRSILRVGATPMPHDEILQEVRESLAGAGVQLKIVPFNDYVQPNMRLMDGDLDANFYQTAAYLQAFAQDHATDLVALGKVHLEPFGLYSRRHRRLADLPDGATVALPNEVSNLMRGLLLLQKAGLIKLRPDAGILGSIRDIVDNPRHLQIKELDAAMLPRVLDSVDIAGINANFALMADLRPDRDALCVEDTTSDYANVVVARQESSQSPALLQLMAALQSDTMREFLQTRFQGVVLPAF